MKYALARLGFFMTYMGRYSSIKDHLRAVGEWLDEHVLCPPTPHRVCLHSFKLERVYPPKFAFTIGLDGEDVEGCSYHVDQSGLPQLIVPMFCSPLGAPASYPAVEFTEETVDVIRDLLKSILPRLHRMGWHPDLNTFIDWGTPYEDRLVDRGEHEAFMEACTTPGFEVSAVVPTPAPGPDTK